MKDPNDDTQTAEDCSVEMCQSYRTRQEHVMRYEKFDWSRYSAFGATVLENFVFLINRAIVSFCFRLLFSFLIPINNELHDTLIICLTMWVWALGQHVQSLWFSISILMMSKLCGRRDCRRGAHLFIQHVFLFHFLLSSSADKRDERSAENFLTRYGVWILTSFKCTVIIAMANFPVCEYCKTICCLPFDAPFVPASAESDWRPPTVDRFRF